MGVGPLSHQEIECWARLMRIDPPVSPFEVHILRMLDRECRTYHGTKNDAPEQSIVASLKDLQEAHAADKSGKPVKLKKSSNKK